jgi:hypothetical protein
MRAIDEVIDAMVAEVPASEVALLERFAWLKKDARYKPPEAMGFAWDNLAGFVNAAIPYPPVEDWHKRVVAVFTNAEQMPTTQG